MRNENLQIDLASFAREVTPQESRCEMCVVIVSENRDTVFLRFHIPEKSNILFKFHGHRGGRVQQMLVKIANNLGYRDLFPSYMVK